MKFSGAIEHKLAYLRLTKAGKIRLSPFSDRIIYCANKVFKQDYPEKTSNQYNVFYGLCIHFSDKLKVDPEWGKMSQSAFNENDMVTENEEYFDPTIVRETRQQYKEKQKQRNKQYSKATPKYYAGPTFTKGLTYWKHGKEYKYPDQAIDPDDFDDNVGPCQKKSEERWTQDDPRRKTLNPVAELQKALRTGKVNEHGLRILHPTWKNLCPPVYEFLIYFFEKRDNGQSIEEIINGYDKT